MISSKNMIPKKNNVKGDAKETVAGSVLKNLRCSNPEQGRILETYFDDQRKTLQGIYGSNTDVLLICNDGIIPAHGVILQAVSPFFEKIFETQSSFLLGYREILLPDFSIDIIRSVVRLVYDEKVYLKRQSDVQKVQEAISCFQIYSLHKLISTYENKPAGELSDGDVDVAYYPKTSLSFLPGPTIRFDEVGKVKSTESSEVQIKLDVENLNLQKSAPVILVNDGENNEPLCVNLACDSETEKLGFHNENDDSQKSKEENRRGQKRKHSIKLIDTPASTKILVPSNVSRMSPNQLPHTPAEIRALKEKTVPIHSRTIMLPQPPTKPQVTRKDPNTILVAGSTVHKDSKKSTPLVSSSGSSGNRKEGDSANHTVKSKLSESSPSLSDTRKPPSKRFKPADEPSKKTCN